MIKFLSWFSIGFQNEISCLIDYLCVSDNIVLTLCITLCIQAYILNKKETKHILQEFKFCYLHFGASQKLEKSYQSFLHHWQNVEFSQVMMNRCTLNEALCFGRLLELKFYFDLKWNSSIRSITKDTEKNCQSLVSLKKVSGSFCYALFVIRTKMEYHCHIWAGGVQSPLFSYDKNSNVSTCPCGR